MNLASTPDAKLISTLLDRLSSTNYLERESAERQLIEIGEPAVARLDESKNSVSIETRARIRRILRRIGNRINVKELVQYEWHLTTVNPATGLEVEFKGADVIVFRLDGSFTFEDGKGGDDERWKKIDPETLEFSYNDRYSVYIGKFNEQGQISGVASNVVNQVWHFRLTPSSKSGQEKH